MNLESGDTRYSPSGRTLSGATRAAGAFLLGAVAALTLLLGACSERAPAFHSTDITGADFGLDFQLRDPDGKLRTLADFRGKLVLVFFGFTQCPAVCPTALLNAAEVRRALGADAARVQVLFVTLDPERDTPALLRQYTAAFDASFIGLYADLEGTRRVAQDFRVFYQKVPTGTSYSIDHSALTYVYDGAGRIRLALRHDQSIDETVADMRVLLRE